MIGVVEQVKRSDFENIKSYQKAYGEAWRNKNKESQKNYQKDWQKHHQHEKNEYAKLQYHTKLKYDLKYKEKKKENLRNWSLKTNYGMTKEEYEQLLQKQHNNCAICGTDKPRGNGENWHVDHNHETGAVRGLLCSRCNQGLGHFNDNIELMYQAINYLKNDKSTITH